jgi:hypothetical protein
VVSLKVIDGAGMTEEEAKAAQEYMRRIRDDARAKRDIEWTKLHKDALWGFAFPVVSMSSFFYALINASAIPMDALIGLLLLVSSITWVLGLGLGFLLNMMMLGLTLAKSEWRSRQTDRILDLVADDRDEQLVYYAWGGDKFLRPRIIVLKEEITTWAKECGISMYVLKTHKTQPRYDHPDDTRRDRPMVWFKRPEHAVAFKMRWY